MRRALLLCVLAIAWTASAKTPFDIKIEQLPDTGFEMHKRGAVSVAYQMTIRNHTDAAIHLKQIKMRTVGRSPYQLVNEPADLNDTVESQKEATIVFSLWRADSDAKRQRHATVWVEGTLTLDSSTEQFATSFKEP